MADAARGGWVRVGGAWKKMASAHLRVGGSWKTVEAGWVRVNGAWKQWYPTDDATEPPPSCSLPDGDYEPALLSGGGSYGGTFDLSPYAGCDITAAAAKISYHATISTTGYVTARGNPSSTQYRTIDADIAWQGRTIYHDLYATAAAELEAGSSTGYSLTFTGGYSPTVITATRLRITIG